LNPRSFISRSISAPSVWRLEFQLVENEITTGRAFPRCHPEAGEARRGTPQLQNPLPPKAKPMLTYAPVVSRERSTG
jgi:hypothetical protein